MTIQRRSRSRNSDYDSGYEPDYGQVRANQDHRLDEFGLSIFREANVGQLDDALNQLYEKSSDYLTKVRGEGREIPPAINILETSEARRILRMGNLAVQTVNDHLYRNVSSLRTTMKVEVDEVDLFGWKRSTIGVTVKEPAQSELLSERKLIIVGLNRLVCKSPDDYLEVASKIPHISLARIRPDTPDYTVKATKEAIRAALPEQLLLKKAVVYFPGSDPRKVRHS